MSLRHRIFPARRHPDLVQTQWAAGWGEAVSGFGYAAEYLTRHRKDFGATIDQVGIAIFYLQRHRVELALKQLMYGLTGDVLTGHCLDGLWRECETRVEPLDAQAWVDFAHHREIIDVLQAADASSTVFRYPVNSDGSAVERPAFIDLEALNDAVDQLEHSVSGYIDYWSELQAAGP